jgi:hypothetical protein
MSVGKLCISVIGAWCFGVVRSLLRAQRSSDSACGTPQNLLPARRGPQRRGGPAERPQLLRQAAVGQQRGETRRPPGLPRPPRSSLYGWEADNKAACPGHQTGTPATTGTHAHTAVAGLSASGGRMAWHMSSTRVHACQLGRPHAHMQVRTDTSYHTLSPKFLKDVRLTVPLPETDVLTVGHSSSGPFLCSRHHQPEELQSLSLTMGALHGGPQPCN